MHPSLPHWMKPATRLLSLFTQPMDGDITMTLPLKMALEMNPMINPIQKEFDGLIKAGEVRRRRICFSSPVKRGNGACET